MEWKEIFGVRYPRIVIEWKDIIGAGTFGTLDESRELQAPCQSTAFQSP